VPTCQAAARSRPPSAARTLGRSPRARSCDLLDRYGAGALQAAITEALARGVPHPNAVRLALERRRAASGEPPPVALVLPEHVARRDAPVRTHELRSYDRHPDQQAKHPHNPPESPDA
jgi:hypothetical protein